MKHQYVLLNVIDRIATVTLNDPQRLNPLSIPLQIELSRLLSEIRSDESIRGLVLTGAGRGFCVGADLESVTLPALGSSDKSLGVQIAEAMKVMANPLITALRELPIPVLSVVQGPAAGAGVGLALAADMVIAARSAYFYLPFMPVLGILPDLGTTWFVPRMVGSARSKGLMLLGDRLSAAQAESWGLIWKCVDDDALVTETNRISGRFASLPPGAALEIRRAHDNSELHGLSEQLEYERLRQRELADGAPFADAIKTFLEKRKA